MEVTKYCQERSKSDPLCNFDSDDYITTKGHIVEALRAGKVNGIVVCTMKVPEELKDYFKDFAPIIKHANINLKDIGPFMQKVASVSNIKAQN